MRQQQVLGGDEFVLEAAGLVEGLLEHLVQRLRKIHAGLHRRWSWADWPSRCWASATTASGVHAAFFEDGADDAFLFLGQGDQQVQREHHLAFVLFGDGLGCCSASWAF